MDFDIMYKKLTAMKKWCILLVLFVLQVLPLHAQVPLTTTERELTSKVVAFLKWYNRDQKKLNNLFRLRFYENAYPDSSNVRIDFNSIHTYLDSVKKGGFVSNKFVSDLKQFFAKIDERLKNSPQKDKYIDDFAVEVILHTFDDRDILDNIDSANYKLLKIEGDKAFVQGVFTEGSTELFRLSRINKIWYIDRIEWAKR